MQKVIFDPIEFIRKLEAVGVPREQADVLAQDQAEMINRVLALQDEKIAKGLAVKEDIKQLGLLILETKSELKADSEKLKSFVLSWMMSATAILLTGLGIAASWIVSSIV